MALAVEVYNDALVEALESAQRAIGYIREQSAEWERKAISNFEDCSEMAVRIEELESQRKMAFMACNRWADKCRDTEKRVAELEARTVTVRLPSTFWYEHDDLSREVAVLDKRLVKKAIRDACECAGIKCEVKGE
ncbi:hypothetical protein [Atlantibacter hermannii]|uniref:hypothetical protein n=1 Tax=Atlantibacter hermannii TaxID=565 RepID=UPI001650CF95|nr:hypothetical protein [Atlantibacter hermannii]